ncbi:hypothetical protein MRB53_026995 [Persea americana]|uniref:Uncharacterized protein n=1 Tax=Persea americana TaxID=3435 RepID=A0ACC2LKT6_PERAE|nr:hypothetical protein MRB53_026995 [Persea americana]
MHKDKSASISPLMFSHFMQKNKKLEMFPNMSLFFLFTIIFLSFNSSPTMGRTQHALLTHKTTKSPHLQTYIVHVRQLENEVFTSSEDRESWYRSFLPASVASSEENRMVYSYTHAITGFAAQLSEEEVEAMKGKEGFVSAFPDRLLPLQTTHTPSFMGLQPDAGFWKDSNFGKGVIIGVLDTGIFPDHPSFSGEGMPPPPAKWKGRCDFNATSCNNKLIGARTFDSGAKAMLGRPTAEAPVDDEGHGTHTSSTAAGAFVKNVSIFGNADGTAVGMAPLAHLAMYKVCFSGGCPDSDILAGLDAAVEDNVDVLSLSIGGFSVPFYADSIAIGAFGAVQKNIFVSCAAGNSGPYNESLSNEAPWILTVGASTMDRRIVATVKLGNGEEYDGESIYQPKNFSSDLLPLVFPGASGKPGAATCDEGSLNGTDLSGKVVLCLRGGASGRVEKGAIVQAAGGAAMILLNIEEDGYTTIADTHVLPASDVSFMDALKIVSYLNSSENPLATIIFKGTVLGYRPSPTVASFSSRGPSLASPGILKPDIIGPGVSVLAAWPFQVDPANPLLTFNIISGTSMATPHLSGIAALLKSSHPDWSPAAIKSAIMTTANTTTNTFGPIVDQTLGPADAFTMGSGHVNPSQANDPGLIYDLEPMDYIPYLCGLNYSDAQVQSITRYIVSCSNYTSISEGELNYPSFSVKLGPTQTFSRTVANVGEANSTYTMEFLWPEGVDVIVEPMVLVFGEVMEKKTYNVTFSEGPSGGKSGTFAEGYLTWVSPKYSVRSPISVAFE